MITVRHFACATPCIFGCVCVCSTAFPCGAQAAQPVHNTTAVSRVCVCVPLPISGPCGMITVVFCGTLPVQLLCVCSTAFPHRTRAVPFAVPTVAQQTALPTTVVTPAPRSDKEISRMYQVRVMAYSCNNPCG